MKGTRVSSKFYNNMYHLCHRHRRQTWVSPQVPRWPESAVRATVDRPQCFHSSLCQTDRRIARRRMTAIAWKTELWCCSCILFSLSKNQWKVRQKLNWLAVYVKGCVDFWHRFKPINQSKILRLKLRNQIWNEHTKVNEYALWRQ